MTSMPNHPGSSGRRFSSGTPLGFMAPYLLIQSLFEVLEPKRGLSGSPIWSIAVMTKLTRFRMVESEDVCNPIRYAGMTVEHRMACLSRWRYSTKNRLINLNHKLHQGNPRRLVSMKNARFQVPTGERQA